MQLNSVVCQNHRLVALFVAEDFGHMVKLIATQRDGVAVYVTGVYKKSAYFHKYYVLSLSIAFVLMQDTIVVVNNDNVMNMPTTEK